MVSERNVFMSIYFFPCFEGLIFLQFQKKCFCMFLSCLLHVPYKFITSFLHCLCPCFFHVSIMFFIGSFSNFICLKVMYGKTTSFPSNIHLPFVNHCKVIFYKVYTIKTINITYVFQNQYSIGQLKLVYKNKKHGLNPKPNGI